MDKFNITIGNNIPEVYLNGDITNMSKTNPIDLGISIKINGFEWTGVANTKWQGNSSLAYDKKNFTIKLYEDSTKATKQKINFNNWGKQNKFVLKANYIDHSHARNDIAVTDRLIEGSGIFSIELCDHIIIGDNEYYSFYENKLI